MAAVPMHGAKMILKPIPDSVMKTEAICPLWGNINWKEEDTASGVSM